MGSVWFSKKAFLYFGGAAVILIGGALVVMAPYHFNNFAVIENEQRTFHVWDKDGYYTQLEVSVSLRPGNSTIVEIGFVLEENSTLDTFIVNMTLDENNKVETQDSIFLEDSLFLDIPFGNYTVTFDKINGAGLINIGFKQVSDSRLFIVVGGSMNFIGLIMGISGYFLPGSFLPTDTDTIVEWGYEDEEEEEAYPGN